MGLRHTYRSKICINETLSDLIPPPTGVVKGPLILPTYSCSAAIGSSGIQVAVASTFVGFSPQ